MSLNVGGRSVPRFVVMVAAALIMVSGAWVQAQETADQPPSEPTVVPAPEPTPATPEPAQAEVPRVFRPQWEIRVDGRAEMNGVLELIFEPNGGEAKLIRVNVVTKAKAKDLAEDLAKELAFTAGANYKVKASGDTIKMKAKDKKVQPFFLGVERQNLTGMSVLLSKG